MTARRTQRPNLFFRLTTLAGAVFVLTILASVAAAFSDPDSPPAVFFDAHGSRLLLGEVCVILAAGILAIIVDRRQTLREYKDEPTTKDSKEHEIRTDC